MMHSASSFEPPLSPPAETAQKQPPHPLMPLRTSSETTPLLQSHAQLHSGVSYSEALSPPSEPALSPAPPAMAGASHASRRGEGEQIATMSPGERGTKRASPFAPLSPRRQRELHQHKFRHCREGLNNQRQQRSIVDAK